MVCKALRLRLELNSILESPSFPDECPISNWPGTGVWFCVVWYGAPNSAWGIGHPSWTLSLRRTMDWVLEDSGSDAVCQWLEGSRTIWIYPGLSPKWRVCWPWRMFVETELAPNTNQKIKSISSWFLTFDIQFKHVYYVLLCIYPTSLPYYCSSLQMPREHGVWTLSMLHGRLRLDGIGVFTLVNNEGLWQFKML